jgi:translocation and assembly module TamB
MMLRVLVALALTALFVGAFALVIARTDFVSNNVCAYAVATIEEASSAHVKVARCTVDPLAGQLTIDGLEVGDAAGALHLTVARVFIHVVVKPFAQRLRLERLEVDHPDLAVRIPTSEEKKQQPKGECIPPVIDSFELGRVTVRKASVQIRTGDGMHVEVPRVNAALNGTGQVLAVKASARGGVLELPGRSAGLISVRAAAHLDLRGTGTLQIDKADVIGTELSAFVTGKLEDLCDPHIDAAANVRVDDLKSATDRLVPKLLTGVNGSLGLDASIEVDKGVPHLHGDLRTKALALEGFFPGELHARFDLTPARLKLDPLEIPFSNKTDALVKAQIDFTGNLPITAEATLHEMELAELLNRLGILRSHVVLKVSGKAGVKGTLAPLQLNGEASLDLNDFAVLDRRFEQRAKAEKILEFGHGHLATPMAIDAHFIKLRGTKLDVQGSRLTADGDLSTDPKIGLDLQVHGDGFSLEDLRGHLAAIPWKGKATVDGHITGPYGVQTIVADAAIKGFHFFDLSLGDVSSHIFFQDLKMAITKLEAKKGRSRYLGNVALDFNQDSLPVEAHIELPEAYLHDLIDLSVGLVTSLSPLTDQADVEGQVTGVIDIKGPVQGPDGAATLQFGGVSLWEQTFEDGDAHFTLHGQVPQLSIDSINLRHGEAHMAFAGTFGPEWKINVDGATENFKLADLDSMRVASLTGPLKSIFKARGVASHPLIDVDTTFTNGYAGKAQLGDGAIALKVDGKLMTWKGTIGTHSLNGQGRLDGDFGYTTQLQLRFPDLSGYFQSFVPKLELEGGSASADVAVSGSLLKWRDSHAIIDISRLKVRRGGLDFENDGPGKLDYSVQGIEIRRLALRGDDLSLMLQGTRSRSGILDVHTTASIDARMLPSMFPDLEHAAGQIALQAAVTGPESSPNILGNLHVEDGELRLRGVPLALRELNGGISFSQDALAIDEMAGKVNNGIAHLSGRVEMKQLKPQLIDISLKLTDVNATLREGMQGTLNGDVTLIGPPLEPTLGGSLKLSRMVYSEDIDIERSLLDFSRRPPQPRVLDRSDLIVHFGLDVMLDRGVRIENNLARTDLKGQLRLTGTSRSFGLIGSINTVRGTVAFRGNDFQIEQGILSFSDAQRIRPSFDFQAITEVKSGQRNDTFKIRLHAYGTPSEPHLKLSSDPALSDADIGFLLTFGFLSQNLQTANFSAADSGLALGIEAVNKMTGFSEQVRRLIPKNAILRDPNIDFVTDYSNVTTGGGARLEAMARFSSHLLNDKLDVRVLEGLSSRRYRAQLGYQISDAISAQFQIDNEHEYVDTDYGADLKMRWEAE